MYCQPLLSIFEALNILKIFMPSIAAGITFVGIIWAAKLASINVIRQLKHSEQNQYNLEKLKIYSDYLYDVKIFEEQYFKLVMAYNRKDEDKDHYTDMDNQFFQRVLNLRKSYGTVKLICKDDVLKLLKSNFVIALDIFETYLNDKLLVSGKEYNDKYGKPFNSSLEEFISSIREELGLK